MIINKKTKQCTLYSQAINNKIYIKLAQYKNEIMPRKNNENSKQL